MNVPHPRTEEENDALRELGNVAFSHAANALSALVGKRVDVSLPSLRVVEREEVARAVAPAEDYYLVTLRILGDRKGMLALVFTERDARTLVEMLAATDEEVEGVLREVSNIMAGSALLAMYRFLRVSLIHGTATVHLQPRHGEDPRALAAALASDVALVVEAEFSVGGQAARGKMVISLADLRFFLDALLGHVEGPS